MGLTRSTGALLAVVLASGLLGVACQSHDIVSGELTVASPAFGSGAHIPKRHAHAPEGENVSPALAWSAGPAGTAEWVVLVEDNLPEGPFCHWLVYGIPAARRSLPEGLPAEATTGGFFQGMNDFGEAGWGGPLPPPGRGPHRYWFWVYALRAPLRMRPGASRDEVVAAMGPLLIGNGKTYGVYAR